MPPGKKTLRKSKPAIKSNGIPVTALMLHEARHELKSEITSFRLETNARFEKVDTSILELKTEISGVKHDVSGLKSDLLEVKAELSEVKSDLSGVKSDLSGVKSDLSGVKSELLGVKADIAKVLAAVHRVGLLVEEQNARNLYVLDGYASLSHRIEKLEKKSEPNP